MRIAAAHLALTVLIASGSLSVAASCMGQASRTAAATQAELQIAVCSEPALLIRTLALRPRGRAYETWLFDDPALTLFEHGLRLRLRAMDKGGDLTLKAAVADCATVPAALLPAKTGKCEHDVHGEHVTAAVSLTTRLDASAMKGLLAGRVPVADVLSAAQVGYLRDATTSWPLPPDLRPLGPIAVSTFRAGDKPYDVDISRLPAGERYIEISRKVALAETEAARIRFDGDLARNGVAVCADQSAQAANKLRALLRAP